jgi:hypothetical protein
MAAATVRNRPAENLIKTSPFHHPDTRKPVRQKYKDSWRDTVRFRDANPTGAPDQAANPFSLAANLCISPEIWAAHQ